MKITAKNFLISLWKDFLKPSTKIFLILLVLFPCNARAGAWNPANNNYIFINDISYWRFDSFVDSKGDTSSLPALSKIEYKPYFEYGVRDDISVGFSPSFQHIRQPRLIGADLEQDDNDAFAYAEIFAKKNLVKTDKGFVLSLIPMFEVPGVYKEETTPFFGKQESFWSLALAAGKNTYNIADNYGYVNFEMAFRSRVSGAFTNDDGSSLKFALASSFPTNAINSVNLGLDYTKSVSGYSTGAYSFLDRYGYDSMQASVSDRLRLKNFDLEAAYLNQFYARNTGLGEGAKVSVSRKF